MAYLALVTPPLVLSSTYTQQKTTPYVAYEQTHTYTHIYTHIYTHTYTHIYTHIYKHIYTHIYTHIYNIHVDMTRYSKSL